MAKEDLFSKLNIKDYNNILEEVLENKPFSEGTKNILLNILYKIETAYDDYKKVKVVVDLKKELLEEIIKNIKKNCKEIEIIKINLNEKTKLGEKKYIIEKNKIISYPNEKNVFYALNHLNENQFIINTKYITLKEPIENLLNYGYIIDKEEIIRDFDGWAWNILPSDIENHTYNLIYQIIKILIGNEFLKNLTNYDEFTEQFESNLNQEYSENEEQQDIAKLIYQIAILENIKKDNNKKENILEALNSIEKEFKELENKKQYLQKIANFKKNIGKEIKGIDEKINNNKLLRESFIEENKKLDESEQIFSLSEYSDILQKRRKLLLKELDNYSELMKPMNYLGKKADVLKEYKILNEINYDTNLEEETHRILVEIQKEFLKIFNEKIKKSESKKEILEYIFLFRYYKLIYINEKKQIKDVKELIKKIRDTEKHLITKACKLKAINILCQNIEENYKLVSKILSYNIIDLEDVNLEFKKQDNNIILTIYDDQTIEDTMICDANEELNVKFNKKIRLFN